MDLTDETTFGDLQKQERFRKLQRELKLARIKQTESLTPKTNGTIPASAWPSCSSINTDPSDFNSTVTSLALQCSRSCSEVLTSSRYLRNLVSKSSILHKPMATSSVKQFSETDQTIDDRAIMPPPSSPNLIRPPAKRPAPLSQIKTTPNQSLQSAFSDVNSSIDHPEDSGCPDDQSRGKPVVRDFHRWRVILNDQGQLLIKGTLENGKIARSKPVLKMFSSTRLESIYKHIYCLHGNIIDEKNELPKYIYTKFFNGFPDDWENVHQIWKNFVAQGCRESYRWPTDISFSDDDLNSEITDDTHIHKNNENTFQESNSIDKSTPQRSSGYNSDIQQEWNSKSSNILSRYVNLNKPLHLSRRNQTIEVLSFPNEKENRCPSGNRSQLENRSQDENRSLFENRSLIENRSLFENKSLGENRSGNLYTALNYAQTLKDFIFEDKLTVITQNLLSENCPREYISYVNQTIENLNYLLSCKIANLNESSQSEKRMLNATTQFPDNKVIEKRSNFQPEERKEEQYEKNPNLTSPQILSPQIPNPRMNCDFSESEIYVGVPKISADRIFQSKPYHLRYKERKLERNLKSNKLKLITENCKNNLNYDSSVSLTEEEVLKSYEGGKVRSNLNKTQVFGGRPGWNPNVVRQNCVPLEVTHKTYLEENPERLENPSAMPNSRNANLIPSDSKKRKIRNCMENIEANKQIAFSEASQGKKNSTIVNSEICERSKRPHKSQFLNFESDDNKEQKEKDEGFKNPFLKSSKKYQDSKKNTPGSQENSGNDSFGSEKNPKLLDSWTPLVTFDGRNYHLVFEGILLNAVGRPMKKKFTSNHVVRRISSKIIETADHQFYKLTGELHNTKHVVPKELWSQCRNGCPTKIDNFCATWIKLTGDAERPQKTVVEFPKNVPSSSRGRRILPPLSYWADERVVMKDNNAIYKPGDPKNHFVTCGINSPKKPQNLQDQENQADSTKETETNSTSKKIGRKSQPNFSSKDPLSPNRARKGSSNSEEVRCPGKNKIAHKLIFSSSDSEDNQEKINSCLKRNRRSRNVNESLSGSRKKISSEKQNSPNSNPYKLRKRQKIDTDIESDTDSIPGDKNKKEKLSAKSRSSQIRWTLKKNIPSKDAFLSDDQLSMA